jgi:hypothetical protein
VNTFNNTRQSATIQLASGTGTRQSVPCTFDCVDGERLALTSRDRIPVSTAVHVEYDDKLFLGEVVACAHNVDDSWHLEVRIEQILTGLQSLMTLRARLLGEPVPEMSPMFAGRR